MECVHEGLDEPSIEDDFELYIDESRNGRDAEYSQSVVGFRVQFQCNTVRS